MADIIKIKKGLDIHLEGKAADKITEDTATSVFAICPDDFPGPVWKTLVKEGDKVNAGAPLFKDKKTEEIFLTSPISGTVIEVKRGERRHIDYISVKAEESIPAKKEIPTSLSREDITTLLKETGLWAMMRQRPYDIVPDANSLPRDIFVTAFDSAPLAGKMVGEALAPYLEKGLEILSNLTTGQVYLDAPIGSNMTSKFAKVTEFDGPHPAGNVGVQISAIKPVNKGETVWTLDSATVCRIGRLFATGEIDYIAFVAVTGPKVKDPHYVRTHIGAHISSLLKGFVDSYEGLRVISGNVLTGTKVSPEGFLHYPYRQITVISEGNDADEFMGWASMNPKKYSVKHTFPAFLRGLSKPFDFDARIKGGKRAMILSGEYDKVFPFDIYPEYLIKAIMANDIDRMEKLGIYEVAPEDFALPEFVDTSKIELQKIVREGLDNLRKELS